MKERLTRFAIINLGCGILATAILVIAELSGFWAAIVPVILAVNEWRLMVEWMDEHLRCVMNQTIRLCNGPSEYSRIADLAAKEGWDYARYEKALNDAGLFDDRIRTGASPSEPVAQ